MDEDSRNAEVDEIDEIDEELINSMLGEYGFSINDEEGINNMGFE